MCLEDGWGGGTLDKPACLPISISLVLVSDCQTSAATLWEREQKKYWPQKVSFGSPDVLKTIVSPHVPLYSTLMSFVSLQVHHKVSKTSSKMKGLSLTASKWGKDLFWSAFIFHSQGKLAFEAENQLPQNGGSISFKVKSYYFIMWYQHLQICDGRSQSLPQKWWNNDLFRCSTIFFTKSLFTCCQISISSASA